MSYDRQIATARRLIEKAGLVCQWQGRAPIDPAALPWRETVDGEDAAPADPVDVPIAWFAPSDVGKGSDVFKAFMAGTEIPAGSEVGLMPGDVAFDPTPGDTVIRNGEEIRVSKIDRLAPSTVPIIYYVWIG